MASFKALLSASVLGMMALAAACSGSTGSVVPQSGNPLPASMVHAQLVIKVPRKGDCTHRSRCGRGARPPRYVSPATTSLTYSIDGGTAKSVKVGPSKPDCTAVSGSASLICTVGLLLSPGKHAFSFQAWDAHGNELSANTAFSYDVKTGKANRIPIVLGGIAASFLVTADAAYAPVVTGTQTSGFSIYGTQPVTLSIVAQDADGDAIVGPGAPQPKIEATPDNTKLSTPKPSSPNAWTIVGSPAPGGPLTPTSSTVSIVATPVPHSGGTRLSQTVSLSLYRPWLYVANNGYGTMSAFDENGDPETPTGGFRGLTAPSGIAYNPDEQWLYVASSLCGSSGPSPCFQGYVTTFDVMGNAIGCTYASCFPTADLSLPVGVAYDPNNSQVYVVSNGTRDVSVFNPYGQDISSSGFDGLTSPQYVAFDPTNDWLYATGGNYALSGGQLIAYDEGGTTQPLDPSSGLHNPRGITYDSHNGWLYVANNGFIAALGENIPGSIAAYDASGSQQSLRGYSGTSSGTSLRVPTGIVYDPYDNLLYVTSTGNGTVQALNEQGEIKTLKSPITGLNNPYGIVLVP